MDDFIYRAIIASIGVSIIAGSLGCFVIWKRLSYFSDSISHSALLGVALGLATGLGINLGLVIVGGLFATLIVMLQQKDFWSNDAVLGIFSHVSLALGIVVLGFIGNQNTDFFAYLFGDILSLLEMCLPHFCEGCSLSSCSPNASRRRWGGNLGNIWCSIWCSRPPHRTLNGFATLKLLLASTCIAYHWPRPLAPVPAGYDATSSPMCPQ